MVERDDALQWLKRLGARGRGDSEDASVVQTLLTDPESPFEGTNDPLFKADLVLTDWKYAIYKTRDSDSVINNLKEIIATLEGQSNRYVSYELPIFGDYKPVDYVEWRFNVLLGLAYNNLGYTYRVQRWLLQAEEAYRKALPYLNKISLMEVQRADTTNNLAFVYRLLGRLTEARILCDDALRERQRQGHSYAIALSFNTLSLISMGMDQYDWALQHCQNARRLIERALGRLDSRGVGLVYNAMGKILRNYGRRWRNEQTIEEAITYLRSSTRIFDDLGEISNQVEAYNELGCSFRALGIVQEKLGKNGTDSFRQAIEYLNEAISLCGHEMPIEKADCYQDLAECYYRMGSDDTALENLEHADGQIDRKYYIDKLSMQLPNFAEMPQLVPECLAMLGKTELLRGDILFRLYMQTEEFESKSYDSLTLQSAIERYICALGYFESFSASSDTLRSVLARLYYRFVEQIRLRSGIGGWYQIQRDRRLIITQVKYYRELYHLVDSPAVNQLVNLIDF
jgi:tetratricopeptide (TPR) repeat protein